MPQHRTFRRNARTPNSRPDLRLLEGVVSDAILGAMYQASSLLTKAHVPHAVVGGLAVGAYGCPRATRDVDFLVTDAAFVVHPGGFVTMRDGVPIAVGSVAVDLLSTMADEPALVGAVEASPLSQKIRVVPLECLIYLKLKSNRTKDFSDVVELIKAGHDRILIRDSILRAAPELAEKLGVAFARADAEQGEE